MFDGLIDNGLYPFILNVTKFRIKTTVLSYFTYCIVSITLSIEIIYLYII